MKAVLGSSLSLRFSKIGITCRTGIKTCMGWSEASWEAN